MAQIPKRTDRTVTTGLFLAMATIFSLFYYFTPLQLDDYVFISVYRDVTGGYDFSLKGLWDFAMATRLEDNCRFSNIMAPVFGVMQPWHTLFPFIAGILTAALPVFVIRFAGIRTNRSLAYSLVWTSIVLFLPWRDSIIVMDYTLNYIFSAFVTFAFVGVLFYATRRMYPTLMFVLSIILAVIAGGWHEGFAMPTLGGLGVLALTKRMRMPVRWYIVVAVYLVAAFTVMYCPGMLNRSLRETSEAYPVVPIKLIADLALVFCSCALTASLLIWKRTRSTAIRSIHRPVFVVFGTAMILSAILSIVVKHTGRTAFYPELCAIVVITILLQPWIMRISRRPALSAIAILTVLLIAHAVNVIIWQQRYYKEASDIMSLYDESPTGTVYYDIIKPTDVPVTTLYFPTRTSQIVSFHFFCLDQLWPEKFHAVVPTELRDLSGSRCISTTPDSIFIKGNSLWTHDLPDFHKPTNSFLNITLNDGTRLDNHPATIIRFVVQPGDTLAYLYPYKIRTTDIADISIASYMTKADVDSLNRYLHHP